MSGAFCFVLGGGSWGRKDGFPGADGSTITQDAYPIQNAITKPIYGVSGASLSENSTTGFRLVDISSEGILTAHNSLVYTIKNPLTFIYGNEPIYDWYTISANYQKNDLWSPGTKTAYDPCPKGWSVPVNDVWHDFSLITAPYYIQGTPSTSMTKLVSNGILYDNYAWFPSEGYRCADMGILINSGYEGIYWSSTAEEGTGKIKYLWFHSTEIYFVSYYRAGGFAIRCIQE